MEWYTLLRTDRQTNKEKKMNQEAKIKRLEERIKKFEAKIAEKDQEIRSLKSLLTQEREWRMCFQGLIKEAAQIDDLKTESWERW